MRPARKASTATSSAAFRMVPRLPPASAAARTASYAGIGARRERLEGRGSPTPRAPCVRAGEGSRSGKVRAYWIGRRMSGSPSWALYEPSVNSTSECTTLWGWITASILEYGSRYSHLASMTSNALLTRVAESIVIFGPIRQVGWASASSTRHRVERCGVATEERSAAGGQHETRNRAGAFPDQALPDRRVLAVDRAKPLERVAAQLVEQRRDQVTAGDERLLVGERHAPPRAQRRRARRAVRPCRWSPPRRARRRRAWPARRARPPPSGRGRAPRRPASAHHQRADGQAASCSAIGAFAVGAGQRHHLEALGVASDDLERLAADRSGRAEDRDAGQITRPAASSA